MVSRVAYTRSSWEEKKILELLFIYVWPFKLLFFIYVYSPTPLTSVFSFHRTQIFWLPHSVPFDQASPRITFISISPWAFNPFILIALYWLPLPDKTPTVDQSSLLPSSCLPPGCLGQPGGKINHSRTNLNHCKFIVAFLTMFSKLPVDPDQCPFSYSKVLF